MPQHGLHFATLFQLQLEIDDQRCVVQAGMQKPQAGLPGSGRPSLVPPRRLETGAAGPQAALVAPAMPARPPIGSAAIAHDVAPTLIGPPAATAFHGG